MTSINHTFTQNYSQPDEYRFSHDSVFLSKAAYELRSKDNNEFSVLDLCAGCGIVGLDFLIHLQRNNCLLPEQLDFIEIQSVYQSHFIKNITLTNFPNQFEFMTMNYENVFEKKNLESKYDLILCNPPYFKKGTGVLSPSAFKNRCRFFLDSDLQNLLKSIVFLLKPGGEAFVLLKSLTIASLDRFTTLDFLDLNINFVKVRKIRSTDLYKITKIINSH